MAKRSRFSNGIVLDNTRPRPGGSSTETAILSVKYYTATFDPAVVAAATSAEQTVTVTGVAAGDIVLAVTKPTATAGVGIGNARVTAANTVGLTFINAHTTTVDPASETYSFVIGRFGTT